MLLGAALLACAIGVAPATMDAVVRVEGGSALAINVNRWTGPQPVAHTVQEAAFVARRFMARGYTVDMGWTQLNSANLPGLGYSVEDAFDGCKNLAGGARVLSSFYGQAVERYGEGQRALMSALSGYNTGSLVRGFSNGYVARYYINATFPAQGTPVATKPAPVAVLPKLETVAYDRPGYSMVIQ